MLAKSAERTKTLSVFVIVPDKHKHTVTIAARDTVQIIEKEPGTYTRVSQEVEESEIRSSYAL